MKLIYLIGNLFWKNKKAYFLLSIEIIITSIIFLALIGKLQYGYSSKEIAETFQDRNAYYFVPYAFFSDKDRSLEEIIGEKSNFEYKLGEVYNLMLMNDSGEVVTAYGYNDVLIDCANLKIKNGVWFNGIPENRQQFIPVVSISEKYEVGDIITITNDDLGSMEKAYVIGEIERDSYVVTFNSGGSKDFADISNFVSAPEAELIIPINSSQYATLQEGDALYESRQFGTIIIAEDLDIHDEIYDVCSDYGYLSDIFVMKENYNNDMRDFYMTNGIVLLIFTLLTLIGIGGFNGIQSILNEKMYTIYYMLGLSRKKCMLLEFMKTVLFLITNYVIIILLYIWKVHNIFDPSSFKITWITFSVIFLYLSMICLLSSLGYVYKLGKKNLIQEYKKNV